MLIRALPFILLLAATPAQANLTERLWGAVESLLGLKQIVVEKPLAVTGHDGRPFEADKQLMISLQAGELSGDPAREDLFSLTRDWLNKGYPKRPVLSLKADNSAGFARSWEVVRIALENDYRDTTVTQFVVLMDQEIEVIEKDGRSFARLAMESESFEIPVTRDVSGEWKLTESAAGVGNLFSEIRGRFAKNAQVLLFMQDARPLFGRAKQLSPQVAHQFFGKLLGLQDAELYVGRPFVGPIGQLAVSQLARRGISRAALAILSFGLTAYLTPDSVGDFVLPVLVTTAVYALESFVQRNLGRGTLSTFMYGSQVTFDNARDWVARKALQIRAEACEKALNG